MKLSFIVSGIAPFLDDHLLVLAYNIDLNNYNNIKTIPDGNTDDVKVILAFFER